jgi:hypothetical protein
VIGLGPAPGSQVVGQIDVRRELGVGDRLERRDRERKLAGPDRQVQVLALVDGTSVANLGGGLTESLGALASAARPGAMCSTIASSAFAFSAESRTRRAMPKTIAER